MSLAQQTAVYMYSNISCPSLRLWMYTAELHVNHPPRTLRTVLFDWAVSSLTRRDPVRQHRRRHPAEQYSTRPLALADTRRCSPRALRRVATTLSGLPRRANGPVEHHAARAKHPASEKVRESDNRARARERERENVNASSGRTTGQCLCCKSDSPHGSESLAKLHHSADRRTRTHTRDWCSLAYKTNSQMPGSLLLPLSASQLALVTKHLALHQYRSHPVCRKRTSRHAP